MSPRLSPVDRESLPEDVQAVLNGAVRLALNDQLAHARTAFLPWFTLSATLLGATDLHPVLRELAILRVAAITPGGDYEREQHVPVAKAAGATEADIAAASGDGPATEGLAPMLAFIDALLDTGTIDDDTWAAVIGRLGPRQTVELMLCATHYAGLARIIAALELEPEPASPSLMAMAEYQRGQRGSLSLDLD